MHALTCGKGGYVIHRQWNQGHHCLSPEGSTCVHSVEVEPQLQPLTGEELCGRTANVEDASRLDLKCKGFFPQDPIIPSSVSSSLSCLAPSSTAAIVSTKGRVGGLVQSLAPCSAHPFLGGDQSVRLTTQLSSPWGCNSGQPASPVLIRFSLTLLCVFPVVV